jgi:pyrroline-5-carboxylate reductase
MPNTPALVQAAASVLAQGTCTMPDDGELVKELLQCIGICEEGTENRFLGYKCT